MKGCKALLLNLFIAKTTLLSQAVQAVHEVRYTTEFEGLGALKRYPAVSRIQNAI